MALFHPIKTNTVVLIIFLFLAASPAWAKKEKKQEITPPPPKVTGQKILGIQWSRALRSGGSSKRTYPESASPLFDGDRVYVGTHSGIFYALDSRQRGRILWQFTSNGPIASQAAGDGSLVYFGNNKGTVYAVEADTGKPAWEHFVGGEILAQPALSGNNLYIVTTSREVYALDARSGDEKWSQFVRGFEKKFTMRGNSPVVVSGSHLYVAFADGQVACLSSKGDIIWTRFLAEERTAFKDLDARLLLEGNALYAVGYYGFVSRLDAKTGDLVWKRAARSSADMETDNAALYLSTSEGRVVAFDKANGTPLWSVALNSRTLSAPRLAGGDALLVGTQEHGAYVLNRSQGLVLQHLSISPGFIGNISGNDALFVVLSSTGRVYALGRTP